MILLIDNQPAVIKDGSSFEYHSDNRLFHDRDDYSLSIELPLGCPQNDAIFGNINRKDVDVNSIYFAAEIICDNFQKRGAVVITAITDEVVKVQFLEKRSYQNFYPDFDKRYIDELPLGTMPYWKPDNYAEASGGRPSTGGGGRRHAPGSTTPVEYKSPAQAWNAEDVIALPWVNNTTGNLQNRADYVNGAFKWHVAQTDDNDTELVSRLSCQPRLYYLVELICEAIGYDFDGEEWMNSDYYYLYSFNTIPAAWGDGSWEETLPHWSLNEFFEQLERLMLCEFDIDHDAQRITFSWSNENVAAAGVVELTEIVDEFTATVTREDESQYKGQRNIGYATMDHEMWNFYSCYWYFRTQRQDVNEFDTLQQLMTYLQGVSSEVYSEGSHFKYLWPIKHMGLYYARDVDTYFVLYAIGTVDTGEKDWLNQDISVPLFRLIPLNAFGDRISDDENKDNIEEIGIVPVWIDDTFVVDDESYLGDVAYVDVGDSDNVSTNGDETRQRTGQMSQERSYNSSRVEKIKAGEKDDDGELFSNMQVGFWFGGWNLFAPYLPCPFIDKFALKMSWTLSNHRVTHHFSKIDSGHGASLRINNDKYGQGSALGEAYPIDACRKYEFSFLSDTMPDVRAVFIIHGKRYLCAQIKTDIDQNGMSQLKKGTFYRILE